MPEIVQWICRAPENRRKGEHEYEKTSGAPESYPWHSPFRGRGQERRHRDLFNGRLLAAAIAHGAVSAEHKQGSVFARGTHNPNRVAGALALVILRQPLAEAMHFHTYAGVLALLEVLRLAEDIDRNGVFRHGLGILHQRLAADVAQQLRQSARLPE